jgi:hypothetical protein
MHPIVLVQGWIPSTQLLPFWGTKSFSKKWW